jgi:hypothetical protein
MKGKTLLCLALVTSMLLGVVMVVPVGAPSTTIGVEPQGTIDHNLGTGSWFTVEIWIRDVADLVGVDYKLGYNTMVLTATSIADGGIFGDNAFPLINQINDTEGWVYHGFMEAFGDPSFNGDGRAAIINFTVDSLGDSALGLYETKLGDSASPPNPISHTVIDGYFSNVHMWLHSEGGLIDLASPVGTNWHALIPGFCNRYQLTAWTSDSDSSGDLSVCDNIKLKNITTTVEAEYGVDAVTVTLNVTREEEAVGTTTNSPSSTAVVTAGWATPAEAYSSNDVYARTKVENAEQEYGTYGFSLPGGSTITGVEVGFEAFFAGNEYMEITCSWDGGSNWATGQPSGTTPASDDDTVRWLDFTSATSWTATKLNNANFTSKIKYIFVSGGKSYIDLDWLPVRVNYTYPVYFPLNFIEFEGNIQDFNWTNPVSTQWHEIYPVFSSRYNLTSFLADNDSSGNLTVSDDIQLKDKVTGVERSYHVDEVSTDIKVTRIPHSTTPEFPLGSVLPIALIVALIYVWRINKRKRITKPQ